MDRIQRSGRGLSGLAGMEKREVAQMSILSRRARVKELSNKAEGIFQYVGTEQK